MIRRIAKILPVNYSFSMGEIFFAFVCSQWVFEIIKGMGHKPYEKAMLLPGIGMLLAFLAAIGVMDLLLAYLLTATSLRSALWFAAVVGPYATMLLEKSNPATVWPHVAGVFTTVAAFGLALLSRTLFKRKLKEK